MRIISNSYCINIILTIRKTRKIILINGSSKWIDELYSKAKEEFEYIIYNNPGSSVALNAQYYFFYTLLIYFQRRNPTSQIYSAIC